MEKMNGKLVTFTGIIVLVRLVAIFGFLFWEPKPEYIQGEAEATEVRISGKVPGRIEIFRFNEGEQVSRGDTVAILDSPEVLAKYSQAEAAEAAAQALNEKAERGTRSEQIVMTYQTWQKAKAAAERTPPPLCRAYRRKKRGDSDWQPYRKHKTTELPR